tara:strand:+ start:275 stop:433 length:159 start_codon:yes stop_codon:yes gene_type:complete
MIRDDIGENPHKVLGYCETCLGFKNKYMKIMRGKRVSGCPDCGDYSITMEEE